MDSTTPIKRKHRPLNPVMEESLWQQIDRRIEQRVVEEADSPWYFPLVPVPKKNSQEVSWLIDYQRRDAITEKDAVPLSNIADNPSRLAGSRIFSALDGAKACHDPPSSEVLCYPDNTAVHLGGTWGHLRILRNVLAASSATGLPTSQEKAQLLRDHIKSLGQEVSAHGTSIPPGYTSVLKDWLILDTRKMLRAFPDKCGYYWRFIANCATISTPKDQRGRNSMSPAGHGCCQDLPDYGTETDVCSHPCLSTVSWEAIYP